MIGKDGIGFGPRCLGEGCPHLAIERISEICFFVTSRAKPLECTVLKIRIIPTLLCRGRELLKGEKFNSWRRVGNTLQAARVHNMRQVDEMVILSLDGMMNLRDVRDLCADCFMPVAIGGGVTTLEHFGALIKNGADKVVLWKGASQSNGELITEASDKFGAQAVVVAINIKEGRVVHSRHAGRWSWQLDWTDPVAWAKEVERLGAGEILLQSVERDGTMQGYDLETISRVASQVHVPVIASGGAGVYSHFADALNAGAHAVAASAMFLFCDATPAGAARYLYERGFNARMDYAA